MRLFECNSIYDANQGQYIEEFFIDGEEVFCDEYFEQLEQEQEIENAKLKVQEYCECCNCEEEITIGDLIDYYALELQEGCQCSDCMRHLLLEFANDILGEFIDVDEEWIRK